MFNTLSPSHAHILYRDATGKFPDFPDKEEGGSEAIFKKREKPVSITSSHAHCMCNTPSAWSLQSEDAEETVGSTALCCVWRCAVCDAVLCVMVSLCCVWCCAVCDGITVLCVTVCCVCVSTPHTQFRVVKERKAKKGKRKARKRRKERKKEKKAKVAAM